MSSKIECRQCGHLNEACIISFEIMNPLGNDETLYLLQCDECRRFTMVTLEYTWDNTNPIYWYFNGPYTSEEAETICMVFRSCRGYKLCHCESHEAVAEWLYGYSRARSIFERADLVAKIRTNDEYSEWKREWDDVMLPQRADA